MTPSNHTEKVEPMEKRLEELAKDISMQISSIDHLDGLQVERLLIPALHQAVSWARAEQREQDLQAVRTLRVNFDYPPKWKLGFFAAQEAMEKAILAQQEPEKR